MQLLVRGGGRAHSISLTLVATTFAFFASTTISRGGDVTDDGVYATPLAVTGIPIALEDNSRYGLDYWSFYPRDQHGHHHGESAIHAWLREQCLAFQFHRPHGALGYGSLGYGGYGLDPGYYGFGLSFHLGYGYGKHSLGVGADGGDPFYGGTGYPAFGHPFPGVVGPLVVDQPVVAESAPGELGYAGEYGPYTGAIPYPETLFAPYTSAAATTGRETGPSPAPPAPTAAPPRVP
jgi:hypothetical protein